MSPSDWNLQMRGVVRLKEILVSLEDASKQIKKLENEPKLTNEQKNKRCIEIVQRIYNHGKDYLEEIGFINNY
ncbi:hypothetical protein [Eubacterium aggregans]|uniref:hypothetical protein n=1 Tax=Eubacterium aggregans TaxID=81409 RepID=UPI003F3F7EA4